MEPRKSLLSKKIGVDNHVTLSLYKTVSDYRNACDQLSDLVPESVGYEEDLLDVGLLEEAGDDLLGIFQIPAGWRNRCSSYKLCWGI